MTRQELGARGNVVSVESVGSLLLFPSIDKSYIAHFARCGTAPCDGSVQDRVLLSISDFSSFEIADAHHDSGTQCKNVFGFSLGRSSQRYDMRLPASGLGRANTPVILSTLCSYVVLERFGDADRGETRRTGYTFAHDLSCDLILSRFHIAQSACCLSQPLAGRSPAR